MSEHITRSRRLTPDEAAKYRAIRQQIDSEKAEISQRLRDEMPGPGSWADLHELRSLVQSLRAERDRRGLSRDEVAQRAGFETQLIVDLEEGRELNPTLSTLGRFAAAVGRHLMMGLSAGDPARLELPISQSPTPASSPEARA